MKETHKVKFRIDKPDLYRKWIKTKKYIDIVKSCGCKILVLNEIEVGVWGMKIIIDKSHPNHQNVMQVCEDAGFKFDLLTVPEIAPHDACREMLQELDTIKSRLKQVA
tara:strand:+ start:677 stop:1000 length:324 start_codon:yes stop_codon:yes gene_type:complete